MGMTSTGGVTATICGVRTRPTGPVNMIGVSSDTLIDKREDRLAAPRLTMLSIAQSFGRIIGKMFTALSGNSRPLDHVE